MSYVPPHLRNKTGRRERRNRGRSFIRGMDKVPKHDCSNEFPALCPLQNFISDWDPKEMIRTTAPAEERWWGARKGYVYMSTGDKATLDRSSAWTVSTEPLLFRERLVDVLDAHIEEFYMKFPSEAVYEPGLDYDSDAEDNADQEYETSDEEYGVY